MKSCHRFLSSRVQCRWVALAILFVLGFAGRVSAQRDSNWRVYRSENGLRESHSTMVSISKGSNIWVSHTVSDSVSVLDGFNVRTNPAPSASGFRIAESPGGQIWAVTPEGLSEFRAGAAWTAPYEIAEIQREYQINALRLNRSIPILPVGQDRVLILLSDQLMEFNASVGQKTILRSVKETGLERFIDMIPARDGGVWISGSLGLAKIPGSARAITTATKWQEFSVDPALGVREIQRLFEDDENGITGVADSLASAQNKKVIVHFDGANWSVLTVPGENIRQAWKGLDDSYWAATVNSFFQIVDGRIDATERKRVSASIIYDVATAPNGVFWLATSDGLYRNSPALWRSPVQLQANNSLVRAILEDRRGRLWFAQPDALLLFEGTRWERFQMPEGVEKSSQSQDALYGMPDGSVVVDVNDGLSRFDPVLKRFTAVLHPGGGRIKALGLNREGLLCVEVFSAGIAQGPSPLEVYDGKGFSPFSETQPALAQSENLRFFFVSRRGELWLGGDRLVARSREKEWTVVRSEDSGLTDGAYCVAEMADGHLWFGGSDRIVDFDGRKWTTVKLGTGRVQGLTQSRDGVVWAGSSAGILRFQNGKWIENGTDEGLPSAAIYAVHEDRKGRIWAGTGGGIRRFNSEVDLDPPRVLSINRLAPEPGASGDGLVSITFNARDKWDYTPVSRLLYAYRLDDKDWSAYSAENTAAFNDLIPGEHVFHVRIMDRNGNVGPADPSKGRLSFAVTLPWYRETRLLLVTFGGVAVALFFAALALNRHLRLIRSYAEIEKIVEIRTGERDRANQKLLHSQKMNALGTLAAGIAHDFNNILSVIKGSAQIIEANPGNEEKISTRVNRIKTVVDQGAGIVRAMLGFSRTSGHLMELHEVNSVVEDTVRIFGDRFQRDIEIAFEWAPSLPPVPCIKDFVQQMLLNFIFNAADAMEGRGRILIKTGELIEMPSQMVLPTEKADHYIFIQVKDTGSGIAPEVLPRIFEPFFTTKALSSRRGTGLGLSMVYELARQIGCGLTVESQVGLGSTFTIVLPVRPLPQPPAVSPDKESPRKAGSPGA